MNCLEELRRLTEAVRQAGADIAPTFAEYIQLAFAIATDCGEAGRMYFHQLCEPCPRYQREHADKLFTHVLKDTRGDVHLSSAFRLASLAGVQVRGLDTRLGTKGQSPSDYAHTRTRDNKVTLSEDEEDDEPVIPETPDPMTPLPTFPQDYGWPLFLQNILSYGKRPQQRDVLLLGALTVIGATVSTIVRFLYNKIWFGPALQSFVVAPSASGKGVLSWVRMIADPFHRAIRREVEAQTKQYWKDKLAFDSLGKERKDHEPPVMPSNRMFLIPGNNSGTGILENIIDSGGTGLVFECEADTVSSSINTDYGNFSDTLRKLFDHELLSFNRRLNHEYRFVEKTFVSIFLSGTPSQVKSLIPSSENGLMSRFTFYYMNSVRRWVSQFDESEMDAESDFRRMGEDWKAAVAQLKEQGIYRVRFSPAQQQRFDDTFARLFSRSILVHAEEMKSSVARLAINLLRMVSVVAVLRALEDEKLVTPSADINSDNLKDGIITRWDIAVTDADFDVFLSMAEPLYLHAAHILSFMDSVKMVSSGSADRDMLLASMPDEFTRQEFIEKAREQHIPEATAITWLKRLKAQGGIVSVRRGSYRKAV